MEESNWFQLEYNEDMDSLVLWIADTTIARIDSIEMEISYYQLDTADQLYVMKDTLEMKIIQQKDFFIYEKLNGSKIRNGGMEK